MRTFIAIDFNDDEYFKKIQEQIPIDIAKIKPTTSYHLTLKFLGEVEDSKISLVKEKLKTIKIEPFSVAIDNIGFFPSESYTRVIWVGFKDNDKIVKLQQQIDNSLKDLFKKDDRFHPHITLARVKFVKDKKNFVKKLKEIKVEEKEFSVKNFKLIKSTLTKQGPIYEDLAIFP